jgi:hypothetical protein
VKTFNKKSWFFWFSFHHKGIAGRSNIELLTYNIEYGILPVVSLSNGHFIKKLSKVNLPFENLLSLDYVFSVIRLF